ncbi:MAG: FKBP-type peptidyl-prolyl cis-trans isomerase [Bacteroidales bacterium]|nr:FKBP-type peptidyl-prolyl cis-trans isomerase [Candidatus Physcousia equi]
METSKYIRVSYELTGIDGEKQEAIETATRENPFIFVSGLGVSLDAFEAQITPLQTGDKFDFTLKAEEAYGERDEDAVTEVPASIFEVDGKVDTRYIYEGAVVPLMNADGQRFNGLIVKMGKEHVTVDLNHPLAGMDLNFKGEVLESREATKEEISGMIKMLAGEGCGGGCGSCGGGCGSCGDGECGEEGGCGGCGGCK